MKIIGGVLKPNYFAIALVSSWWTSAVLVCAWMWWMGWGWCSLLGLGGAFVCDAPVVCP